MFSFIILHNSEVFLYTLCVPITRRLVLRALEAGECLCAFIQFQISAEKCKLFLLWYIMILRTKGILSTMVHGLLRISCSHNPKAPQIRSFFYEKWLLFGVLRVNKSCFFMQARNA